MTTSPFDEHKLPLLTVRRLHNYVYCPRLFYLQWVENIFIDNEDTVEGSAAHKRVDQSSAFDWSEVDGIDGKVRSLFLESAELGLTGVIDLLDMQGGDMPKIIDYKKGRPLTDDNGAYQAKPNDIIQLAAYAMLLREHGVSTRFASIYYAEIRRHITVDLTEDVLDECRQYIVAAKETAMSGKCPSPLCDSARCAKCSAYPVCLPYETRYWQICSEKPSIANELQAPRPQLDDGEVLVVQNSSAYIKLSGGEIIVKLDGETVSKHPVHQLQAIYLYGSVQISSQAIMCLIENNIGISYFSPAGRFIGMTSGLPPSGVDARLGQAKLWHNPISRCEIAAEIIRAKIHNQRVLLLRNGSAPDRDIALMSRLRDKAAGQSDLDSLRGIEGAAAALYFKNFHSMLKGGNADLFDFNGRNKRPPKDPVNALLSLGYSILSKELAGICFSVGLDPFLGFYHSPGYGRAALALDLMEEFRPLIADSVAISLINRGEISETDFKSTGKGVMLTDAGRRQFWRAWFRRMDTSVTHPEFGYKMSYRRMMDVQARQLWRFCRGEAERFRGFTTR